MRILVLSLAASLLVATAATAGECGLSPAACGAVGCETGKCSHDCTQCPRCGSDMVCKLVCGTKEIKKTVWNVKCEPICLANPSCGLRACDCGDSACGGCEAGCSTQPSCGDGSCGKCKNCCDPCAVENAKHYNPPKCGKVRVKKTLEKKEAVCKVPSYKCVPTCPNCGNCRATSCGGEGSVAPAPKSEKAAPLPPAPAPGNTTQDTSLPPVVGTSYKK